MLKQAHLYIKGDVIGVGFRAWTKIQAKIIGVSGWVRNNFQKPEVFGVNGGVETLIQGDEEKVNQIMEILKRGSPVSRVEEVEIIWQEPKQMFDEFEIRK
ncbi:acylphosphatase [Candidatus Roizmanbacteria bacterium CG22_combo_CG10-13_8_21_14_all_35_9]|uniref:acylphosphatase n=4 Tax=Candidatus Roizmaniibacteriota TaxID=1752723 RepID=A0A2M8F137_9BACT|nr:MAG: acylphosphatase [Candidatus Roizmanbacteria bacterium CG23_combo_of_CG06-09_8_20_14_all_35_49]PIP62598.1 MAG: acylphosphatase [Candidatus Roizmanbacteria bacterium CG22_combo_CG10-13_8_21_14_all_35_9]PIY70767.1 MAG: acylphosphatase [Candidatus Roizmanbacteria bacterium CG_4_10_14_0_8_um_filter_35_28]PJC33001.1 MAG: acylphosphatase [Candidatus Roizmanbacteria bacterium CG_4_9_14_0_2_um_filter_35_15]PJC82782.1 MAG: acylphosphatase [Candidatus Roizmanbacteria bacterium CG_4_8_14_3_um_filte